MKPFVLRRLKSEVLKDLPQKNYEIILCPLIEKQSNIYNKLVVKFSDEASEKEEFDGAMMMMQLRKLANHPLLFRNNYEEDKLLVGKFMP